MSQETLTPSSRPAPLWPSPAAPEPAQVLLLWTPSSSYAVHRLCFSHSEGGQRGLSQECTVDVLALWGRFPVGCRPLPPPPPPRLSAPVLSRPGVGGVCVGDGQHAWQASLTPRPSWTAGPPAVLPTSCSHFPPELATFSSPQDGGREQGQSRKLGTAANSLCHSGQHVLSL